MPEGTVVSQEEAMRLFKIHRAEIIKTFRETAARLLSTGHDAITAREVINVMKSEGTYRDYGNDKWSGAAWRDKRFKPAGVSYLEGETYNDSNTSNRRAHGAYHVIRWTLNDREVQ